MVLKFPSGRVFVSVTDLHEHQHSQPSCGICGKLWVVTSSGCILHEVHVLHPCQHVVGSGCWATVPDEQKDRCPVCKVQIWCVEGVRVYWHLGEVELELKELDKKMKEHIPVTGAQQLAVTKRMEEGIQFGDVVAIMLFLYLRAHLDKVKDSLGALMVSHRALTPAHLQRLVLFLRHAPRYDSDSKGTRIAVALYALNISRGTSFTLGDLRKALSSKQCRSKWPYPRPLMNREMFHTVLQEGLNLEKGFAGKGKETM